jgi:type VI protein secretion system component Hcp
MSLDAFMVFIPNEVDGIKIEGETQDAAEQAKRAFEIIDFKWGASATAKSPKKTTHTAPVTDGQTLPPTPPPDNTPPNLRVRSIFVDGFSVSKPFDAASLGLFQACTKEKCTFPKAVISFRKFGDSGEPFVYLSFEFLKVRVDKIDWKIGAVEGGDKPDQEDVDFSFETCNIFYFPQTKTGAKKDTVKKTATYSQPAGGNEDDD